MLQTRNTCKFYRSGSRAEIHAVEDVSLLIPRGSFTALTGPSGSGKSTLLALLGAVERPTRGQVLVEDQDLGVLSDVALARLRRRMGFIFQDFALIPDLAVWENVTYPLIPRGVARARRQQRARALLERLGIADKFADRPQRLSGGEQQRVAVARALAGEPEVLFADEPTSNLDPGASRDVLTILQEQHAGGTTVVVASHDPQLLALASGVHELRAGRLVPTNPSPL